MEPSGKPHHEMVGIASISSRSLSAESVIISLATTAGGLVRRHPIIAPILRTQREAPDCGSRTRTADAPVTNTRAIWFLSGLSRLCLERKQPEEERSGAQPRAFT